MFHPCAPCPLICDDISGQAECPPDRPAAAQVRELWAWGTAGMSAGTELSTEKPHPGPSLGCWHPTGQVLGDEGRCVWPWQCPCLVDGTHYWRGQRIEADCRLCICRDGRPRRCRPNPDCAGEAPPALPEGSLVSSQTSRRSTQPCCGPDSWPSLSELWLVILVSLDRVPGSLWEPQHSVVLPERQQCLPRWPTATAPARDLRGP